MHYDVVSNSVLWFLFHDLFDRIRHPNFDDRFREAWNAYRTVNDAFADATADAAPDGAVVLVNDYQLSLTGARLRELRPDLKIAHFTHTPFCGPDDMRVLPTYAAEDLCRSLACNPAGFHTSRWARSYQQTARDVLGRRAKIAPTFAASLGPDVSALNEVANSAEAHAAANALDDLVGDRLVIARSDRIEPSKNIVRGFLAYDRLLEARPGLRGRVVFVAMLYPSRETLPEYLAYTNEIEEVVARVNDRWATRDWTPILLDERDDFPRSVAAMQRYDVLLVNPIKDGLNLVAKEGPAVNRRDGLLCLSREAGAYEDLRAAAIPVHPYDLDHAAAALDRALATPLDERADIAKRLRALAIARTPSDWVADLVANAL
jgi:trehalose 6-phosphate synthase